MAFYETSAKEGPAAVDEVFFALTKGVVRQLEANVKSAPRAAPIGTVEVRSRPAVRCGPGITPNICQWAARCVW
jgi:hypothetical protein